MNLRRSRKECPREMSLHSGAPPGRRTRNEPRSPARRRSQSRCSSTYNARPSRCSRRLQHRYWRRFEPVFNTQSSDVIEMAHVSSDKHEPVSFGGRGNQTMAEDIRVQEIHGSIQLWGWRAEVAPAGGFVFFENSE